MKFRSLTVLVVLALSSATGFAFAEEADGRWRLGTELDVLPFATGGYYGSLVLARDEWRFRGVVARTNIPQAMVADGFEDKRTDAYALLVDRFLGARRQSRQGFWIGGGLEFWRNRIRSSQSGDYSQFNNTVLTAGAGYVWQINRHVYLNPWAGAHFVVGGSRCIPVSGKIYEQPVFSPEVSVKVGFTF